MVSETDTNSLINLDNNWILFLVLIVLIAGLSKFLFAIDNTNKIKSALIYINNSRLDFSISRDRENNLSFIDKNLISFVIKLFCTGII